MEKILNVKYTWGNWLLAAMVLLALYFLLRFIDKRLAKANFLGRRQDAVHRVIRSILLIYEPMALIVLGVGFVFINPMFHGLGLGLLLLAGFMHIRNYFNGRIVLFDKNIKIGAKLSSGGLSGVISELGRLGLRLKNNKGLHFINYSKLLADGYLLHSGEEVGGYYRLKIAAKEDANKAVSSEKIMDTLAAAPYLDWDYRPEVSFSEKNPEQLNVRVSVNEENHLHDLIALIKEQGYDAEVLRK